MSDDISELAVIIGDSDGGQWFAYRGEKYGVEEVLVNMHEAKFRRGKQLALQYEVVLIDEDFCIFWRDEVDATNGEFGVLKFWANFGPDMNKARHTADILNGRFPAI